VLKLFYSNFEINPKKYLTRNIYKFYLIYLTILYRMYLLLVSFKTLFLFCYHLLMFMSNFYLNIFSH
jgi:hypothetical protein